MSDDSDMRFFEISWVKHPLDPRARIFDRHCDLCNTDFPSGMHPDNECEMRDVFNTMEE